MKQSFDENNENEFEYLLFYTVLARFFSKWNSIAFFDKTRLKKNSKPQSMKDSLEPKLSLCQEAALVDDHGIANCTAEWS